MKRDLTTIREILEFLEAVDDPRPVPVSLDNCEEGKLRYHLRLCEEAGLITEGRGSLEHVSYQLTWKGHVGLDRDRGAGGNAFDHL